MGLYIYINVAVAAEGDRGNFFPVYVARCVLVVDACRIHLCVKLMECFVWLW